MRRVRLVATVLMPLLGWMPAGSAAEPPTPAEPPASETAPDPPSATEKPDAGDAPVEAAPAPDAPPEDSEPREEPGAEVAQPPAPTPAAGADNRAPGEVVSHGADHKPAAPKRRVKVHIDADEDEVALRRLRGRFGRIVCRAPCDQLVEFDEGDWFVVEGDFTPVSRFHLDQAQDQATIVLDAGSEEAQVAGIAMMGVGATVIAVTGFIGLFKALGRASADDEPQGAAEEDDFPYGPIFGPMAGGAALVVVGAVLLATNDSSLEVVPGPGGVPQVAFRF